MLLLQSFSAHLPFASLILSEFVRKKKHFFCSSIFFLLPSGIVQMDPLDNNKSNSKKSRETGLVDGFKPELIPLQQNSYLGKCLIMFSQAC